MQSRRRNQLAASGALLLVLIWFGWDVNHCVTPPAITVGRIFMRLSNRIRNGVFLVCISGA
jgi:uncharacterized membrane protein